MTAFTEKVLATFFIEQFVGAAGTALGTLTSVVAGVSIVSYFAPEFWSTGKFVYVQREKKEV